VDGVRTLGLSKTYKSIIDGKSVEALKNAYFEINRG